jgi:Domain of unknown function (DUF4276)
MRLIIVVEGKTEEEFVNEILRPYFYGFGFYSVTAIKYQHLKSDVLRLLHEPNALVTTFVDYFRIPTNLPNFDSCQKLPYVTDRIVCLEKSIKNDIGFEGRFIPYIQQHEFEALLFTKSQSFEAYYDKKIVSAIETIIAQYENPEDINDSPNTAPSKRLLDIIPNYKKVTDGNLIALETGIEQILAKCPRFRTWIDSIKSQLGIS